MDDLWLYIKLDERSDIDSHGKIVLAVPINNELRTAVRRTRKVSRCLANFADVADVTLLTMKFCLCTARIHYDDFLQGDGYDMVVGPEHSSKRPMSDADLLVSVDCDGAPYNIIYLSTYTTKFLETTWDVLQELIE